MAKGGCRVRVLYDHGVHIEGTVLWFDPTRRREMAFVSCAARPGARLHRKILCTPETARYLSRPGRRGRRPALLPCPYYRPFTLGALRIELHPAGWMHGAAQLAVVVAGQTVVYAGALCLDACAATPGTPVPADVLIVDGCVWGPDDARPKRSEAIAALRGHIDEATRAGQVLVVLCAPVGQAQDLLTVLEALRVPVRVHRSIHVNNVVHAAITGHRLQARRFRGRVAPGEVLLWPAHLADSPLLGRLDAVRHVALVPHSREDPPPEAPRGTVRLVWPREPSFPALRRFVRATGARWVHTLGPADATVAGALRDDGLDAFPLLPGPQLRLDV